MQRQATLLLACLGRHKPHIGSGDCLTDRLGVNRIVLMRMRLTLRRKMVAYIYVLDGI